MDIKAIPALRDNYIWRLACAGNAVVIDPGDCAPVLRHLQQHDLRPTAILITHRHADHIGGLAELKRATGAPVFGPGVIADVDHPVREGDHFTVPGLDCEASVMALPGHLDEHVAYRIGTHCFCGDVLFSAGCGRNFEGPPEALHHSLQRLAALPPDTLLYPAHEYTLRNLEFAARVEADNPAIAGWRREAEHRLATTGCSLPTTVERERQVNPFLRFNDTLCQSVAAEGNPRPTTPEALFVALRRWRSNF